MSKYVDKCLITKIKNGTGLDIDWFYRDILLIFCLCFTFQFFQPSSCKTKWRGHCSKWNPISQRNFIRYWGKVCLFNLQRRDEKLSSNAGHQSFDKRLEMKEKKNLEIPKKKGNQTACVVDLEWVLFDRVIFLLFLYQL